MAFIIYSRSNKTWLKLDPRASKRGRGGSRLKRPEPNPTVEQGRLQDLEACVRNTNGGPKIYEIVSNRNKACTFTK